MTALLPFVWAGPGVLAKGGITRSPRKTSEKLILRRRKFGTHQQRPQTVNV